MSDTEVIVSAPRAAPEPSTWRSVPARSITLAELGALVVALGVALVGTAGLAASYLGRFSGLSVAIGTLILLLVLLPVLLRLRLPRIVLDPVGLGIVVVAAGLAAFMFIPGFHYAAGDKDPGIYMEVGANMARTGHLSIISEVLADPKLPVQPAGPGAFLTGLWIQDDSTGLIVPQFYHMWSALLGVAYLLHGFGGETQLTPVLGVVCVVLAVLVGRRIGGPVVAGVAGVLLATNMMQVWQAKYPSTEILAQLMFLAALLAVILAIQAHSRSGALAGGVLVGAQYLARPDGILLVGLAIGVLGLLWIMRRFDGRALWFTIGLAVMSAFGVYQAYGWAAAYTNGNLPSAALIFGGLAAIVVVSLALRPLAGPVVQRIDGLLAQPVARRRAGVVVTAIYVLLFCVALVRPLVQTDTFDYHHVEIRTYDERSLYWLSWFFTWPGLLLALAGIAVVMLRKWTASAWLVVLPVLTLMPIYLLHAHNSPYLMWWGRRFIPVVVPGLVLLIAVALSAGWSARQTIRRVWLGWVLRIGAVAAALFLTVVFLVQSLPLRAHNEMGGSYQVVTDAAALSGGQNGVYLWDTTGPCCSQPAVLFAGPLWLYTGMTSTNLPGDPRLTRQWVSAYVDHFTDRPVFLVIGGGTIPAAIASQLTGFTLEPVQRQLKNLPLWATSADHRPDAATAAPVNFTVYRVTRA